MPMREAIEESFARVTGYRCEFIFSGWGGELTEPERAVHENRQPGAEIERLDRAALAASSPAPAPAASDAPDNDSDDRLWSREDWIAAAQRVYEVHGDDEKTARELAAYHWGEQDMQDLADPYEAALDDIEGRPPAATPSPGDAQEHYRISGDCGGWSASHDGLGTSAYTAILDAEGTVVALAVAQTDDNFGDADSESIARKIVAALSRVPAGDAVGLTDEMRDFIEGMSVSVDVSTGEHDAGHRYFGTVTEVMDDRFDKHGVTLLVQDAKPNFEPNAPLLRLRADIDSLPLHAHKRKVVRDWIDAALKAGQADTAQENGNG
jgi:hypothetical protein